MGVLRVILAECGDKLFGSYKIIPTTDGWHFFWRQDKGSLYQGDQQVKANKKHFPNFKVSGFVKKTKKERFHFMFGYYQMEQCFDGVRSFWHPYKNSNLSLSEQLEHNQKDPTFKTVRFTPSMFTLTTGIDNADEEVTLLNRIIAWFR